MQHEHVEHCMKVNSENGLTWFWFSEWWAGTYVSRPVNWELVRSCFLIAFQKPHGIKHHHHPHRDVVKETITLGPFYLPCLLGVFGLRYGQPLEPTYFHFYFHFPEQLPSHPLGTYFRALLKKKRYLVPVCVIPTHPALPHLITSHRNVRLNRKLSKRALSPDLQSWNLAVSHHSPKCFES